MKTIKAVSFVWIWCLSSVFFFLLSVNFSILVSAPLWSSGDKRLNLPNSHFHDIRPELSNLPAHIHLRRLLTLPEFKSEDDMLLTNKFPDDLLGCNEIEDMDKQYLISGWTKAVFTGVHNATNVAIKYVDAGGKDVKYCLKSGQFSHSKCLERAAMKLVREILLHNVIGGPNIIKLLGFCIPPSIKKEPERVALVTEHGEQLDMIRLLQMSWEDRLRVANDMAQLLNRLRKMSRLQPVLSDFRREQLVLVNGVAKLVDLDDVGLLELSCKSDKECQYDKNESIGLDLRCQSGKCIRRNDHINVMQVGRHVTSFTLLPGAPETIRPLINKLVNYYTDTPSTSGHIYRLTNHLVQLFRSGAYLQRNPISVPKINYEVLPSSDLPGTGDYYCRESIVFSVCAVSVHDIQEGEEYCNADPDCTGFVSSNLRTWTGRRIIYLKNNRTSVQRNENTVLYLKNSPNQ